MSPGCGHGATTLKLVEEVVREHVPGQAVETITVATTADAARWSFPGSPTVRVNDLDIEPAPPTGIGLG